ncbi:MAG: nuclear transport factor 2 family protein [Bacteroidota bacterium]
MHKLWLGILLISLGQSCSSPLEQGFSPEKDRKMVLAILENLDSHTLAMDAKMSVYAEDVVHMGPGNRPITKKADLRAMLEEDRKWGHSEMKHEAYEIHSYADHVIVRGGVKGTWYAKDGSAEVPFETNNLITLKRNEAGELQVWHVIFNRIED